MQVLYILKSDVLASTNVIPYWSDSDNRPFSQVFICPKCGDSWGRVMVGDSEWVPVRRNCSKHGRPDLGEVGGSFLPPWRKTFHDLPLPVLQYEVRQAFLQRPINQED